MVGKKCRTAAAEAGGDQSGQEELLLAVEKLQEIQEELEKVNKEAEDKVYEVEQKYNEAREPVYQKRSEIIASIPNFWLTAFLSHPTLGDMMSDEDQEIFKYLDSLVVEDLKDFRDGYCIEFNFKPNPFFENVKLTKTIKFLEEGTLKATASTINWKDGKGPVEVVSTGEQNGNKRPLVELPSFFNWFKNPQPGETVEVEHDLVAEMIKEDLWPNPIKYLNNEDDLDDEDDSDEDDDDELEEDEEDAGSEEDDS